MRARLISRAQGRAQTVRQLGEIAVGDEGVAQSLLLLFGERQEGGLADSTILIPPVTVKLAARAALPSVVLARAETGARPLRAAMLVAVCASAHAPAHHEDDEA